MTTATPNAIDRQRYCVFKVADQSLAVPALAVREICEEPSIVTVPTAPRTLLGICHVRNEFLPVICLRELIGLGTPRPKMAQHLLVITGTRGAWGILTDGAITLDSLEATHTSQRDTQGLLGKANFASALHGDRVVTVLELQSLYRLIESRLDEHWGRSPRTTLTQ